MSMDRVHSLGDSWTCIEAGHRAIAAAVIQEVNG